MCLLLYLTPLAISLTQPSPSLSLSLSLPLPLSLPLSPSLPLSLPHPTTLTTPSLKHIHHYYKASSFQKRVMHLVPCNRMTKNHTHTHTQ